MLENIRLSGIGFYLLRKYIYTKLCHLMFSTTKKKLSQKWSTSDLQSLSNTANDFLSTVSQI